MYDFIYYRVGDVMTRDPVVVETGATLSDVEAIFEAHDFNGLPVVDKNLRLIGMITKLDLLKAFAFTKKALIPKYSEIMNRDISSVMTKNLHAVNRDTPLTRVLGQMVKTGYKSFPVVMEDRLMGVVAREDVMRALRRAARGEGPG
jgi:CBS domain-containing protein